MSLRAVVFVSASAEGPVLGVAAAELPGGD